MCKTTELTSRSSWRLNQIVKHIAKWYPIQLRNFTKINNLNYAKSMLDNYITNFGGGYWTPNSGPYKSITTDDWNNKLICLGVEEMKRQKYFILKEHHVPNKHIEKIHDFAVILLNTAQEIYTENWILDFDIPSCHSLNEWIDLKRKEITTIFNKLYKREQRKFKRY